MRKSLTAAMAAVTLGGAICATATPVDARPYHGGNYHDGYRHDGNRTGTAIAAGALGLALGAALSSSNHGGSYGRGYGYSSYGSNYSPAYYPAPYYDYAPAYRVCEDNRWVWDPYIRRNVLIRSQYAC